MTRRRAGKLKVQLPVEMDETESESEIKHEIGDDINSSSFRGLSNSCEAEEQQNDSNGSCSDSSSSSGELSSETSSEDGSKARDGLEHGKTRRLEKASVSSSDSSSDNDSDEDSEVDEKPSQDSKDLVKAEVEEDAELSCEEASDEDTDTDDDWSTQLPGERDVENTKKADEIVDESDNDSDAEWCKDEWEHQEVLSEDGTKGGVSQSDISEAKFVLRNITARIPLVEETAIRRGVKVSGPPLEFATTHLDEYARKFRWPQHVRNLRNTNFSQDPIEILEDYELLAEEKQSYAETSASPVLSKQTERDLVEDSAFAQVPRPMVALAAEALQRSSQKRKRSTRENDKALKEFPSALTLLNFARVGGLFSDHFVESLLSANGKALQGIDSEFDSDIDKRSWSSLPTKKKPIANWRFVLEHVRRTMGKPLSSCDAVYPPMKKETLERITNRLKKLHGCATQHQEDDIFERKTRPSKTDTNAVEAASKDHSTYFQ